MDDKKPTIADDEWKKFQNLAIEAIHDLTIERDALSRQLQEAQGLLDKAMAIVDHLERSEADKAWVLSDLTVALHKIDIKLLQGKEGEG